MWDISRFKRFLHTFTKSEWVNVFLTAVIAAMSVVGTFLVIQGGKDTARIRDAAEKQACAANKSAQASRDFADTAAKINSGIGDAVGKLDAQAKAIEDSRRSSESASLQSLNASIESSRLDQRAWVGTGDAVFTFSPTEPPKAQVTMKNTGKTPALQVAHSIGWVELSKDKTLTLEDIKYLPNMQNMQDAICFPTQSVPLDIQNGQIPPTGSIDLLKSGEDIVYVFGKITYADVSGKQHWTEFCMFVDKDLVHGEVCKIYNTTDDVHTAN
jgi:hypothetical protein